MHEIETDLMQNENQTIAEFRDVSIVEMYKGSFDHSTLESKVWGLSLSAVWGLEVYDKIR